MNLFTKFVKTQELEVILQYQLKVSMDKMEVVTFDDIPDMNWIFFKLNDKSYKLIHHAKQEKFGFEGALLSLEQTDYVGNEETRKEFERIMKIFANSLGGLIFEGGDESFLEGFNSPGTEESVFILRQLHLKGFSDDKISDMLSKLDNKIPDPFEKKKF